MEENRGEYLVIWHALKCYRKRGLINRLLGRKAEKIMPMVNDYETEEIARYGLNTVKSLGGLCPRMVKVIGN